MILAVIAALLLLYIIFRSAGNINYVLPETTDVEQELISRITIDGPMSLEFSKSDDQWFIQPEGWHAENSNLTAISKALAELKLVDLISTSGNPGIYALDEEQRVLVKAFNGDTLVREIYVGKVSNNGIYTYIMFPGDENIYSVRGNLPSRVKDRNSMRDKRFVQIDRNTTLKMTLRGGSAPMQAIFKDADGVWRSITGEPDDAAVKAAVNMLDPLRCKDFIYEAPADSPEWIIDILTEDGIVNLEIWAETDDEIYPARCSQNGYMVQMTPYATEKLLGVFGVEFAEK